MQIFKKNYQRSHIYGAFPWYDFLGLLIIMGNDKCTSYRPSRLPQSCTQFVFGLIKFIFRFIETINLDIHGHYFCWIMCEPWCARYILFGSGCFVVFAWICEARAFLAAHEMLYAFFFGALKYFYLCRRIFAAEFSSFVSKRSFFLLIHWSIHVGNWLKYNLDQFMAAHNALPLFNHEPKWKTNWRFLFPPHLIRSFRFFA